MNPLGARLPAVVMFAGAMVACAPVAWDAQPPWGEWLLPPEALGEAVRVVQQVHIVSTGQAWLILTVLDVSSGRLALVGMSGFGRRVITLQYDGILLSEEPMSRVPEAPEGRRLLRGLQLIYWPRAAVAHGLPPGWEIEDVGTERMLKQGGGIVVRIRCEGETRWQGHCEYEDLRSGYRLAIDSKVEAP
jgi:hypothetical protein